MSTSRPARHGLRRTVTTIAALAVCGALGVGSAAAYWTTSSASTSATTSAATLKTPVAPSVASTSSTSLTVAGALPTGQLPGTTYSLQRNGGTTVCSPSATPWSCTDTGLTGATTYSYTLVATLGAWTATSAPATGTTQCSAAASFVVSAPSSAVAGNAISVQVIAKNCLGATDTSFTGQKALVFSGPGTSPSGKVPSYPATVSFANGVGTASVTLYDVETAKLTATFGSLAGQSGNVTVAAGDPYTLLLTAPSNKNGPVTVDCSEGADLNEAMHTCSQGSPGSTGNSRVWRGYLTLVDKWGNLRSNNLGAAITVKVSRSPTVFDNVSIAPNATTSDQFEIGLSNGNATATITATTTNTIPAITVMVTGAA